MPTHTRTEVINKVNEIGVIPIFYHDDLETAINISKSCYEGDLKILEFTNRGIHAVEIFAELEKFCSSKIPDVILGAGSIIDPATAAIFINHGANFIVGPSTNPDVAKLCNRHKIAYIPGCSTPSEISNAEELGVEFIKIFPGEAAGGPNFVKDVLGPLAHTSIIPTGGVDTTEISLRKWFSSGVSAVGIGSKLITKEIIKTQDWDELKNNSQNLSKLIKIIRKK
ncbi:MAG: bifunctional 4-hydroxy-2-oxoglutarate aldolase/2-dehydro-3-deoxy-phosphogluconate aldolase [Chloroflexi bacterium]|nr:bifunctional 4-hydroxy-2-oxoglutarate aldolase/2-dehydro-3-deoxy-phosphogluconate aldolase [Chloroflexota bacterium]|tara:strand:- start:2130 stop:2804 length:675 start_codon:yes stop_codon:yes gene_type:complete